MNLTEQQIKKLKPLLIKLVNEVKRELKEEPLNRWDDAAIEADGEPSSVNLNRPQQPFKLGINKVQFLPSGGLAIRTAKATLTLSDEEAKKLSSMIVRIIGK